MNKLEQFNFFFGCFILHGQNSLDGESFEDYSGNFKKLSCLSFDTPQ